MSSTMKTEKDLKPLIDLNFLQEDIQILMNAIKYLEEHNNDAAIESEGSSR